MKVKFALTALALSGLFYYCKSPKQSAQQTTVATTTSSGETRNHDQFLTQSPIISPKESLKYMKIEEGFQIELVASEPLLNTPVGVTFDGQGRMWTIEMPAYMPDTAGTGEEVRSGQIAILEDKNGDGVFDTRTVFLDSLVLPRAICLIEDGILVAESPNLWYYKIVDGKPAQRTLVDPEYAIGGNVEHQPNGLLRALDNWIYNAKSSKRYRKNGDKWLIEETHFRGQWGISQDNYGRLYYNHNSANVLGDYFLPGLGIGNSNQRRVDGFSTAIVANNKVYPARPTSGVNRGYMKGILDDSLRLVDFTAACGPLFYRGDLFGPEYENNAFVPEPAANLIKRNLIQFDGYIAKGEQAYVKKEFLTSTDERFRPVSLYNAADGAMYIVDMYRGIIQHKTYLTPYLKSEIAKRDLTPPLDFGRIYRISPKDKSRNSLAVTAKTNAEFVQLLASPNGWIRDYAQQQLVDRRAKDIAPQLRNIVRNTTNELERIHAVWVLEGIGALDDQMVLNLLDHTSLQTQFQAFGLSNSVINKGNYTQFVSKFEKLLAGNDRRLYPYIAFSARAILAANHQAGMNLLQKIAVKAPSDNYVAAAVVSNLKDRESGFQSELIKTIPDTSAVIHKRLNAAITAALNAKKNRDPEALAKMYPKGSELYATICQTCHGVDGNGVANIAPPLNKSEWVTGDKKKLMAIVLYGLSGPIMVNNHLYKAPEIVADMPGIGYDPDMKNEDIAELLSYIRNAWENKSEPIHKEEVETVRTKLSNRSKAYTVEELNTL